MLGDENSKQLRTITGGPLKKKDMLRDNNDKQVRTITGGPLKKKEMFRDKKGKQARTYAVLLSTWKLINKR